MVILYQWIAVIFLQQVLLAINIPLMIPDKSLLCTGILVVGRKKTKEKFSLMKSEYLPDKRAC